MIRSLRHSPFLHLAWKEYRVLRSSWIGSAVSGIAFQILVMSYLQSAYEPMEFDLWAVGMLWSVNFAIWAGSMSFAWETESGTDDLLRSWSAPASMVLSAKCFVGLALTFALSGVLLVSAETLALIGLNSQDLRRAGILPWTLIFSTSFLSAVLASVFVKRMVIAYGITALIWFVSSVRITSEDSPTPTFKTSAWMLFLAGLFAIDAVLVRQWMRGRLPISNLVGGRWRLPRPADYLFGADISSFGRLVWLECRVAIPRVLLLLALQLGLIGAGTWFLDGNRIASMYLWFMGFGASIYLGVETFHHDQQQNFFRFLSERGASPLQVWMSKQSIWLPLASLLGAIAADAQLRFSSYAVDEFLPLFGFFVAAYLCGQCAASATSNASIAYTAAVLACLAVLQWCWLMSDLGIPFWWSTAPIPLVLLAISLFRTRDILEERTVWNRLGRYFGTGPVAEKSEELRV